MNTRQVLKVIGCLLLLFVLGSVCGYALSGRMPRPRASWMASKPWAERWLQQRMTQDFERLGITTEQEAKIRPVYDQLLADFNAIQRESQQKVADAFRRHRTEMRKHLTPEQREQLRQWLLDRPTERTP